MCFPGFFWRSELTMVIAGRLFVNPRSSILPLVFGAVCLLPQLIQAAPVVQFVGANPVGSPTWSTTFSPLPATVSLSSPQSFDGFTFNQVNGNVNGIWTTYNPGGGAIPGWYPNGGDFGYTQITLTGGGDFGDVGVFVGSGNGSHAFLAYELLDNGVVVSAGTLAGHQVPYHWLSITGGGFDTIRLRDGNNIGIFVGNGTHNALAFDQVFATAAAVPEPMSLTIWSIVGAVGGVMSLRRRLNRSA